MNKKSVKDLKYLNNKTVFLTTDYNVTISNGKILNDRRIRESLKTIKILSDSNAKIIIASHLGRPKGEDKKYSLKPIAKHLESITKRKVRLIEKFWDDKALQIIKNYPNQDLILLDNIRFHPGEKKNDAEFARYLSSMADLYVNDAFGTSHRIHASIVGIAEYIPGYAGILLENEVNMLEKALKRPDRPFLVIIGGAKTPEKISVIERILDIADTVILGGAIANTFLAAWGYGMGKSMVDYEMIEMAKVVFWKTTRQHSALILPSDVVIYDKEKLKKPVVVDYNLVPQNMAIYDIGDKTIQHYSQLIQNSKTVIWNGPMGLYEDKRFAKGTDKILSEIAKSNSFSIIGGGDTLSVINSEKYASKIDHISTGGSAMLEYLKKGSLPGIEVLQNK
jgi:phosphoglycerate kinase